MDDPKLRELEKKVEERRSKVNRIVEFVGNLVIKHGEEMYRAENAYNTHTKWELRIDNFLFKGDFGQTSHGGNDIYILYNDRVVYHVYYQAGAKEIQVKVFIEDKAWLMAIKRLMQNRAKVVARLQKQLRGKSNDKAEQEKKEKEKREYLLKEAKRLGLTAE